MVDRDSLSCRLPQRGVATLVVLGLLAAGTWAYVAYVTFD